MKTRFTILTFLAMLALCGCATTDDDHRDEKEYSDLPWNTPQRWEGSRQVPGLGGGGGGGSY